MPLFPRNPLTAAERAASAGDWLAAGGHYEEAGELARAIECFEKAREFGRAGELALTLECFDLAAMNFRRAGDSHRAATLFRKLGKHRAAAEAFLEAGYRLDAAASFSDAGDFEKAAEILEQAGRPESAAAFFEQAGRHERAGEVYARAGQFLKAAACYEKTGDFVRAGEIYEKSGRAGQAASAYGKANDFERAARLLEQRVRDLTRDPRFLPSDQRRELEGAAKRAARFFAEAGTVEKAIEVLERAELFESAAKLASERKFFTRAGDLYLRAGNAQTALEMYALGGDTVKAAKLESELYLDRGEPERAAEALVRAREPFRAAEIFESIGNHERASACYEECEAWEPAAEAAVRSGPSERAAVLLERAGHPGRAAEIYERLGHSGKAVEGFAAAGRYFEAARAAAAANREREMLQYLQLVPEDDPHHREALVALTRAFIDRGWSAVAVTKLETMLAGKAVHWDDLDLFYLLAEALEDSGELERAEATLRSILAITLYFGDVDQRRLRLLEKIEEARQRIRAQEDSFGGNRYELGKLLGRGGMGEVYRAFDRLLNRTVAYKVLSPKLAGDTNARDQLLMEARSAAALNHPNIVTIHDLGVQEGRAFICMELIEGESYTSILRRQKRLETPGVVHLLVSVCQGLDHAHHRGIIHRDLKPSNIVRTVDNLVKILDFGLAQSVATDPSDSSGGSNGGTPRYIAPEQARGEPTDARSDIYSLGATLFELIAGRPPFTEGDLLYHHQHTPPPRLTAIVPDVFRPLEELVLRCLAKSPSERFSSAKEILLFVQASGLF